MREQKKNTPPSFKHNWYFKNALYPMQVLDCLHSNWLTCILQLLNKIFIIFVTNANQIEILNFILFHSFFVFVCQRSLSVLYLFEFSTTIPKKKRNTLGLWICVDIIYCEIKIMQTMKANNDLTYGYKLYGCWNTHTHTYVHI